LILGEYADALVRAGLLEQMNPLQVLRALQARKTAPAGIPAGIGSPSLGKAATP
jgi:hypothetical protein